MTSITLITSSTHFSGTSTPTPSVFTRYSYQTAYTFCPQHQKPITQTHPSHLHTSHIDFSTTQHFNHFTCQRIHVLNTRSESEALLQFLKLVNFKNTTLCLCAVSCCSLSGVSDLLFVVGMCECPRVQATSSLSLAMFLDCVGARGTEIVSMAKFKLGCQAKQKMAADMTPAPVLCRMPFLTQPFQFYWAWERRSVLPIMCPMT